MSRSGFLSPGCPSTQPPYRLIGSQERPRPRSLTAGHWGKLGRLHALSLPPGKGHPGILWSSPLTHHEFSPCHESSLALPWKREAVSHLVGPALREERALFRNQRGAEVLRASFPCPTSPLMLGPCWSDLGPHPVVLNLAPGSERRTHSSTVGRIVGGARD